MTRATRATLTIDADGNLRLPPMPQAVGKTVDVIILVDDEARPSIQDQTPVERPSEGTDARYPLRGRRYRFDDAFTPALATEE